jgi:hypothetical protein
MRLCAALTLVAASLPMVAAAGELRVVAGQWNHEVSGSVTDQGERLNFQDDLGLKTQRHGSTQFEYRGAGGLWPDWALAFTQVGARGRYEETHTLFVGPIPVGSETVRRDTDGRFDDLELVLRYPLGGRNSALSAGLTLKHLKGEILIFEDDREDRREQYDEIFPLLHLQARRPFLRPWLALSGSLQGLRYQDNAAREWRVAAEAQLFSRLLLELGWQEKRYRIDAGSYALDARFAGPLIRGGWMFGG